MEKGTLSLAIALGALLSGPAASNDMCASYKPIALTELNRLSATKGIAKGEYETTADWHQRMSDSTSIALPIDPPAAKDLRDHLSIVMVGILAPPFAYSSYFQTEPKISDPQEGHFYERGLVISPECAALVDNRTWSPVMLLDPKDLGRRAKGHGR